MRTISANFAFNTATYGTDKQIYNTRDVVKTDLVIAYEDLFWNATFGIETPDRNGQWYQHLLTLSCLCAVCLQEQYRRDSLSDYVYMFYVCKMWMFCVVFNFYKIWLSEKPWGDRVRLTEL